MQFKEWLKHIPNKLTLARMVAIPVLLLLYPIDIYAFKFIAACVFLGAALTDFFDGYLARKYNIETPEGALLDPIADKMLVMTGLVLLVSTNKLYSFLAVLLICRESFISGVRLIAMERQINIDVNMFGKFKTGFQVAGIFALMIDRPLFDIPFRPAGMLCIWVALGLSLYSGYLYWQVFWQKVNNT